MLAENTAHELHLSVWPWLFEGTLRVCVHLKPGTIARGTARYPRRSDTRTVYVCESPFIC